MPSGARDVLDCFCLHTRRASRQLTQFYDRALRPSGLRVTQFQLLAAVHAAEPIAQQPLADLLGMDRTTLTRNLALLHRDGLLQIDPAPRDRREHHLRLTAAGRIAVADALPLWRSAQEAIAERLKAGNGTSGPGTSEPGTVLQVLNTLGTLGETLAS